MAGVPLGSAAIGAAVTFGTTLYNNEKGFSARHEQCYDFQTGLTQQLVEGFTKAHREGEVDDEDHEAYILLRDRSLMAAADYSNSISEYKETPTYNIPRKLKLKKKVRVRKGGLRSANEDLQGHYSGSLSSCGSDASSIMAESGSPPGSGLESEQIREWTETVRSSTLETGWKAQESQQGESQPAETLWQLAKTLWQLEDSTRMNKLEEEVGHPTHHFYSLPRIKQEGLPVTVNPSYPSFHEFLVQQPPRNYGLGHNHHHQHDSSQPFAFFESHHHSTFTTTPPDVLFSSISNSPATTADAGNTPVVINRQPSPQLSHQSLPLFPAYFLPAEVSPIVDTSWFDDVLALVGDMNPSTAGVLGMEVIAPMEETAVEGNEEGAEDWAYINPHHTTIDGRNPKDPTASGTGKQRQSASGKSTRMYLCDVEGCGKFFARGEHLKRHLRSIHTFEKFLKCPYPGCGKGFSQHDNLGQHMRVHDKDCVPRASTSKAQPV